VAAVLVVVAVAATAVLLTHRSAGDTTPPPTPTPTAAKPTAPTHTPTPTPGPTVPAGYHRSTGPAGSSIAVPAGWTRQARENSVLWKQPSTGAYIQVDAIPWGVSDPVEHWRVFEHEVRAKNVLPGFQEIRLSDRFPARGWSASDLEYTWNTRDHGTMRAIDRGFTANGRQYAILVAAPMGQWARYSTVLDGVFGSFQPATG
jgi:hypothetical protein